MKIGSHWFGRKPDETSAHGFLSRSMDVYASMTSFQATVDIEYQAPGAERKVRFERPNRFRIDSSAGNGYLMTSVCDGRKLVEYTNKEEQDPTAYPAPKSISSASSMFMKHPMFCGSLLYAFFGGASSLANLVQINKASIEFGEEEDACGERAVEVTFYGAEMYGHTKALIGLFTSHVYRLAYDSEPLAQLMNTPEHRSQMRKVMQREVAKLPLGERRDQMEGHLKRYSEVTDSIEMPELSWTVHTYRDIVVDAELPAETFDATIPDGREAIEQGAPPKPPVPIGDPAPDFTVHTPDGEALTLSALRGQVVLIDLWATWCGPCRKGLPDTMKLSVEGAKSNFCVLAITNDDAKTVSEFVAEEGLAELPAYIDTSGEVWAKYKVTGIPTILIIDAEGNLAAHLVGLRPLGQIKTALRAAGASVR